MAKAKDVALNSVATAALLAGWATPPAVREGVTLVLPDTDAEFRVRLPSKFNKPYARAVGTAMFSGAHMGTSGKIEVGVIDVAGLRDAKMQAFAEHCLICPLPGGISPMDLMTDYFPAFEWLFDEAERLGDELDKQSEDARKKSKAS